MGFLQNLFRQRLVGLDIGISGIKAVEIQTGKKPRLLSYNRVPLPWDAIEANGRIADPKAVSEAVKTLFESSSFSSKKVVVGAPAAFTFTKRIAVEQMSQDELQQQIVWEAEQYLPCNIKDVNLDFAILGSAPDQKDMMEVLLVAVKKNYAESLHSLLSEAGLDMAIVDTQPFALGNVFEFNYAETKELPKGAVSVLIDFGAGSTKVSVVEQDKTIFAEEFASGGTRCSQLLGEALGLDLEAAETKKITDWQDPLVKESLREHNQLIVREIEKAIEKFMSQFPDKFVESIYICGGASLTSGLKEHLESELGYTVKALNAVRNFSGTKTQVHPKAIEELSYLGAVAIGLSLRSEGDS